jgi:hypothetical protein
MVSPTKQRKTLAKKRTPAKALPESGIQEVQSSDPVSASLLVFSRSIGLPREETIISTTLVHVITPSKSVALEAVWQRNTNSPRVRCADWPRVRCAILRAFVAPCVYSRNESQDWNTIAAATLESFYQWMKMHLNSNEFLPQDCSRLQSIHERTAEMR